MKPSSLLLTAALTALLAVSTTAWPYFPPPHIPFIPPGGGSAPAPSSGGGFPSAKDVTKCLKAMHDGGAKSCLHRSYDGENCCTYLTSLGDSCSYVPYLKSPFFHGILKHVCDGGSGSSPPPSS